MSQESLRERIIAALKQAGLDYDVIFPNVLWVTVYQEAMGKNSDSLTRIIQEFTREGIEVTEETYHMKKPLAYVFSKQGNDVRILIKYRQQKGVSGG